MPHAARTVATRCEMSRVVWPLHGMVSMYRASSERSFGISRYSVSEQQAVSGCWRAIFSVPRECFISEIPVHARINLPTCVNDHVVVWGCWDQLYFLVAAVMCVRFVD